MKKMMLSLMAVGMLAFTANTAQAQEVVPPQQDATLQENKEVALPEQPKFANEDANKGLTQFTDLVKEYGPAVKASDATKSQEFGTKVNEWQQGAVAWISTLSAEEQTKLQAYMQQVGETLRPQAGQ